MLRFTQIKAPQTAIDDVRGTTTDKTSFDAFTVMGYKVVEKIRVRVV